MKGELMASGRLTAQVETTNRRVQLSVLGLFLVIPISISVVLLPLSRNNGIDREAWVQHQANCRKTPVSEYQLDRARKVSGMISNEGSPVPGIEVQLIDVQQSIEEMRRSSTAAFEAGLGVVEAMAVSNEDGFFEIQGLTVGIKAIVARHPLQGIGSKSFVIVQGGVGTRVDLDLKPTRKVHVELPSDYPEDVEIYLIQTIWKPITQLPNLRAGRVAEFDVLDSEYYSGLVMVLHDSQPFAYAFVTVDSDVLKLQRFNEQQLWKSELANAREWLTISSWNLWHYKMIENKRFALPDFYAFSSPVAALLTDSTIPRLPPATPVAEISGLTIVPHSPVIVSALEGDFVAVTNSDDAMEFRVSCPPGAYAVRTFGWNGNLSHLKVIFVGSRQSKDVLFNRFEHWDEFVEKGRIVGVVKSNFDSNDELLEVVIQDAENFRRFIHKVPVKDSCFVVGEVPLNRPYVGFVSLNDSNLISFRNFFSIVLTGEQHEEILTLNFNNNRVIVSGSLPSSTTLVARAQLGDETTMDTLFSLQELSTAYEMINLPTNSAITVELIDGHNILSRVEFEMTELSTVHLHIGGGEIEFTRP